MEESGWMVWKGGMPLAGASVQTAGPRLVKAHLQCPELGMIGVFEEQKEKQLDQSK